MTINISHEQWRAQMSDLLVSDGKLHDRHRSGVFMHTWRRHDHHRPPHLYIRSLFAAHLAPGSWQHMVVWQPPCSMVRTDVTKALNSCPWLIFFTHEKGIRFGTSRKWRADSLYQTMVWGIQPSRTAYGAFLAAYSITGQHAIFTTLFLFFAGSTSAQERSQVLFLFWLYHGLSFFQFFFLFLVRWFTLGIRYKRDSTRLVDIERGFWHYTLFMCSHYLAARLHRCDWGMIGWGLNRERRRVSFLLNKVLMGFEESWPCQYEIKKPMNDGHCCLYYSKAFKGHSR